MKKVITILLCILLAASLGVLGYLGYQHWYQQTHVFVEDAVYEKDAASLDLRGSGISVSHYEQLRAQMPECHIRWDVPFREGFVADDAREITVTALTEADIQRLDYLTALETVDATACTDYEMLLALQDHRPEVTVHYQVTIGGEVYDEQTQVLKFQGEADIPALVENLPWLPRVQAIQFNEPSVAAEDLVLLKEQFPGIRVSWCKTLFDTVYDQDTTQLDFSGMAMDEEKLDALAAAMPYFPNLEKVLMVDCGLENEEMAAFRERVRPYGKVVWAVDVCGTMIRTDETYFMPVKYNIKVTNNRLSNLVYCEDMLCVDLGHKRVTDISWVSGMPHLKYFILADGIIMDISPISQLKELIYCELFYTWCSDFTPLYGCTALQDLNVSKCYANIDPTQFGEMPWLKNLWLSQNTVTKEERAYLAEKLPDTHIYYDGYTPTSGGWRELQNYYDMRDLLEMPYNPW